MQRCSTYSTVQHSTVRHVVHTHCGFKTLHTIGAGKPRIQQYNSTIKGHSKKYGDGGIAQHMPCSEAWKLFRRRGTACVFVSPDEKKKPYFVLLCAIFTVQLVGCPQSRVFVVSPYPCLPALGVPLGTGRLSTSRINRRVHLQQIQYSDSTTN